ncbi:MULTISPECIES: type VI secretion system baseplate subunit TssE [unclassified Luteibacter]|uniref:type VI secretion system baseplate subunit TssE n=1 Tax=unclassified Luteibacter TaxID=2620188 RepID=UPI0008AE8304|nr:MULTISPECIES: type VI secretion system baseplate subunit TssE [unclassified Luteibacter]MDR6934896.1 type VI secretion system protein ImpF [Luteibacter sp. 3190]SEO84477.1 type VI secretion system protein ImpF [Luteibacter sp. UNC138MFCol5.1]SEW01693.1 type VI secretion system protein ImpF [Luteibacter sp. 329MFSha]
MAELTTQERLQPSLLDRLRDDEPHVTEESREKRVMTAARLREHVVRDLGWLFNCTRRGAGDDEAGLPHVGSSVIGYGIPDLTGAAIAGMDVEELAQRIRASIVAFEPRLDPASLQVDVQTDVSRMDRLTLSFRIVSTMWAQPMPLNLYLRTEVDLETARFSVFDGVG